MPKLKHDADDPRFGSDYIESLDRGLRVFELFGADRRPMTLSDLAKAAFSETNPIPAKAAVHLLGFCREEYRLPIVPITPSKRTALIATLIKHGLLAAANA